MPWALFEGSHGTKIVFQRSTDGGRTWTPILPLSHSPNTQNQGTTVAVGPGGVEQVAWEHFHKDQLLCIRPFDYGPAFSMEQRFAPTVPVSEPLPDRPYCLDCCSR